MARCLGTGCLDMERALTGARCPGAGFGRLGGYPAYATMLNDFYTEGHTYPVEHWLKIRDKRKWYELSIFGMPAKYIESWTPEAQDAPQLESMMKNVKKGKKTHPGSLINY